ncbi:MAG: class I SAM-dependent methyltransferase [Deltaproteobacteria bacterium]|nr:class I SAM-dependent methyltransferase [Deltaproteobacteria bacterium]
MKRTFPCPLCADAGFRTVHTRGKWRYLACRGCGLVRIDPMPRADQALACYDDYLPGRPDRIALWEEMMRRVVRESAHLIEAHSPLAPARVLDVGCGYGFFAGEMKARGWDVVGVEPSPEGREHTARRYGIPVHKKPLEELDLEPGSFQVVTLFYVIEHVTDPLGLLRKVRDILVPGGVLLLRWPHSTPIVRILGPLARLLDLYHTPYHLYDFSPSTMKRLLATAGLTHMETRPGAPTKPPKRFDRWSASLFGRTAQALWVISGKKLLFPGVSKTTLASNPM